MHPLTYMHTVQYNVENLGPWTTYACIAWLGLKSFKKRKNQTMQYGEEKKLLNIPIFFSIL